MAQAGWAAAPGEIMGHDFTRSDSSVTSRFGAYMRLFTDIPYAADIAEIIHARTAFETFLRPYNLTPEDLHFYAPYFEARHKSIGAMIQRLNPRQVLEIGASLSPRGMTLSAQPHIFYVETDLEEMIGEKRALIAALHRRHRLPARNNLRVVPADALDRDQLQSAANYFKSGQRLLIVHEGLLQYFTASETERVARNIHELLSKFGGIWITPDFSLKSDSDNISDQQRHFRSVLNETTHRTIFNNAFDSVEHLREYFRSLGFKVEVFNQLYLAPELSSVARLGLKPELIDELRPRLRLWSLRI
jgi:O-methyltransferase involved in polyketide biosynthesis